MRYQFSEKSLGSDFRKNIVEDFKLAIQKGASSTLLGMPLAGMVTFCRYLATTDIAFFVYIDAQSHKYRPRNEFFLSLYNELGGEDIHAASINAFEACKKRLRELCAIHERIVILVARLDYLKEELTMGLLSDFKTLSDININKIMFIASSRLPFYQISPTALTNNPSFMVDPIYFLPYNREDFNKIVNFLPGGKNLSAIQLDDIFILSGGHHCLIWQLIKTDYLNKPLNDDVIKIHLHTIYHEYFPHQQSQLRKIAAGRKISNLDPFLLKIGLVKEINGRYELFTPLLRDYILQYIHNKLPKKERLLFALFKKKLGKLLAKDEIFQVIWKDQPDSASDWALNSLIYRLRKHSQMQGYIIENEKGEGYRMFKES